MKFTIVFVSLSYLLLLTGCGDDEGDGTPSCQISEEVGENELLATVDGSDWVATSSGYQVPGAVGLITSYTVDAHNLMSIRLHHTALFSLDAEGLIDVEDGDDVGDVFEEAGAGPFEFLLGSASRDGGDITLVIDDEVFHTADGDGAGGYLYIEEVAVGQGNNPDVIRGCFEFDAGSDDSGEVMSVLGGSFSANAM
jgi:hypothetical protein